MFQIPLPPPYNDISTKEADSIITTDREKLGQRLVILGHHYQRDDIIKHADFTGDSLKLSQLAAQQEQAEFIVFCGVHFMAESADILSNEFQKVLLPDLTAGCSMADMADIDQVEQCWQFLQEHLPVPDKLVPITYVNSSAAIKAFCGRNGGTCCTSSNCQSIFDWYWQQDPNLVFLFLPDQHLGRNTAFQMGVPLEQMALWDPYENGGGITPDELIRSRIILWKGFCSVHQEFTLEQVQQVRRDDPGIKVIVHPECNFEVVQAADFSGSTEKIIHTIHAAPAGSSWAVGTELNLVNRLAEEMAPKNIRVRLLSKPTCLCDTMYRIDLPHLSWLLDQVTAYTGNSATKKLPNRIVVPDEIKQDARRALEQMLVITSRAAKG